MATKEQILEIMKNPNSTGISETDIEALRLESAGLKTEIRKMIEQDKKIQRQIIDGKKNIYGNNMIITDHAIVRFLQRIEKIDMSDLNKKILEFCLEHPEQVILKENRLITILPCGISEKDIKLFE